MTDKVEIVKALTEEQVQMEALGSVSVKTTEDLEQAVDNAKRIKAYKKAVKEYWDPLCDNAYKTWKALTGRRKEFLDPAEAAEKAQKLGIGRYHEAERKKQAAEMKKRQEAERKAAEEKRLAEVEEMQDMGELEAADHIAQQPLDVKPIVEAVTTKVEGMSVSYRYSAEVEDLGEFLTFLVEEPRFRYLVKDFPMKELNKLATAQKEMFDIPGVKLVKKVSTSIRG